MNKDIKYLRIELLTIIAVGTVIVLAIIIMALVIQYLVTLNDCLTAPVTELSEQCRELMYE